MDPFIHFRILVSPLDKYSEQRKQNETKTQHFHVVNSGFGAAKHCFAELRRGELEAGPTFPLGLAAAWGSFAVVRTFAVARGLFAAVKDPHNCPDFSLLVHFTKNPTQNHKNICILSRKTSPKWVLTQPKPIIEIN